MGYINDITAAQNSLLAETARLLEQAKHMGCFLHLILQDIEEKEKSIYESVDVLEKILKNLQD